MDALANRKFLNTWIIEGMVGSTLASPRTGQVVAGNEWKVSRCRFGRHQPKLIAPSVRTPSG